jgi:hypothetical protein
MIARMPYSRREMLAGLAGIGAGLLLINGKLSAEELRGIDRENALRILPQYN